MTVSSKAASAMVVSVDVNGFLEVRLNIKPSLGPPCRSNPTLCCDDIYVVVKTGIETSGNETLHVSKSPETSHERLTSSPGQKRAEGDKIVGTMEKN